jgi:hypothetical protein
LFICGIKSNCYNTPSTPGCIGLFRSAWMECKEAAIVLGLLAAFAA